MDLGICTDLSIRPAGSTNTIECDKINARGVRQ